MYKGLSVKATVLAATVLAATLGSALCAFAQSKGTVLTITTEPNSTVWIDDIRFGTTDASGKIAIKNLGGTRHIIKVRSDGFKEASKTITRPQEDVSIALTKSTDAAELAFQEAERMVARDRQKAADAYRRAVKQRPGYTAAYIGLARVLSDSGDHDGALAALRDLRRTAPANAEASAVEGRIYKESGDEDKAIAAFKRSILQGRGFQPEAYTGLGLLYKEKAEAAGAAGDFDGEAANYNEAATDFSAAVKQLAGAPDAVVIYQLLGLVYEKQKKFNDAIRVYNEFLQRFPDSNDAPAVKSFIQQIRKQQNP
jgi:tetratricopeptide (TPR) repeat protein